MTEKVFKARFRPSIETERSNEESRFLGVLDNILLFAKESFVKLEVAEKRLIFYYLYYIY